MSRKLIEEEIQSLSLDFFGGEMGSVIQSLTELYHKHKEKYEELTIHASQYYEDVDITLDGKRYENDKEYNARLAEEKKRADAKAVRLAKASERAILKQKQHTDTLKKLALEGGLPENTDLKALKEYLNSLEELA